MTLDVEKANALLAALEETANLLFAAKLAFASDDLATFVAKFNEAQKRADDLPDLVAALSINLDPGE